MLTDIHQKLFTIALLAMIASAFFAGFLIGWLVWEDNNVVPLDKPDCELRKGYYTVISVSSKGITNCGITKSFYRNQETQE